jgi:UDP-N-acetylmuramate: L-alanyl-gamma-D-glutamyl-meso-diaminopimelate ligase
MPLLGDHNVRNALVAIAVGVDLGLDLERLRKGLAAFKGVKRRLEVVGEASGVTVYDDFAHHPTAVDETLKAVRRASPGKRIWAIFEPRSASSCRRVFQDDFARAFAGADEVVIASVFRSSLPPEERLSESRLVGDLTARNVHARHLPDVEAIVDAVAREARAGDLIVVMSNGGFGGIHGKLLAALN